MKNRFPLALAVLLLATRGSAATIGFDDLSLGAESAFAGPTANAVVVAGPFGPSKDGTFTSGGAQFNNHYDVGSGISSGFSYSNKTDTTLGGFENPYIAVTGSGAGPGNDNYGVSFGYLDQVKNNFQSFDFDPSDPAQLYMLPSIQLPAGFKIASMQVTNTTYSAGSMAAGDGYGKQFGGPLGTDPDFDKITAYGTDAGGNLLPATSDFYLADFRFANDALDYIVDTWKTWDLSSLSGATHLYFNISSSDVGTDGLKTPAYFAADNIVILPVPEPSSLVLLILAAIGVVALRLRTR